MKTIKVSREMLLRSLAQHIAEQSAGMADIEVIELHGVIKSGEAFEIESLEVAISPKPKKQAFVPTAKAGVGKIRLAAIDGEVIQ